MRPGFPGEALIAGSFSQSAEPEQRGEVLVGEQVATGRIQPPASAFEIVIARAKLGPGCQYGLLPAAALSVKPYRAQVTKRVGLFVRTQARSEFRGHIEPLARGAFAQGVGSLRRVRRVAFPLVGEPGLRLLLQAP